MVADVPFVDVLNTMLDDTLPADARRMAGMGQPDHRQGSVRHHPELSPYDQVTAQDYPPMLITGGLTDPRVTYWEPAKWAAGSGQPDGRQCAILEDQHGCGARWQIRAAGSELHEVAETYAFMLTGDRVTLPPFEMSSPRGPSTSMSSGM